MPGTILWISQRFPCKLSPWADDATRVRGHSSVRWTELVAREVPPQGIARAGEHLGDTAPETHPASHDHHVPDVRTAANLRVLPCRRRRGSEHDGRILGATADATPSCSP
jgi:hypothetical protein